MRLQGKVHRLGDNINTDIIIAGKYTKTLDFDEMRQHTLEGLIPNFASKAEVGDIIVAGDNFGLGSSREQAPLALKLCGIKCVVAKSFARIFFRNGVNLGLVLVECNTEGIAEGDFLELDLDLGILKNCRTGEEREIQPLSRIMQDISNNGGLIEYMKAFRELD